MRVVCEWSSSRDTPVRPRRPTPKHTRPKLLGALKGTYTVPRKMRDQYGNPVVRRDNSTFDPETGLPYEIWLTGPRMELVLVPAGTFKIGDPPLHDTHVPAFYIGKYEVTNRQWKQFVDANSKWRKGRIDRKYQDGKYLGDWQGNSHPAGEADHPVGRVSWFAANAFCRWAGGRLPTEAGWEKACRAGSTTTYHFGDDASPLGEYAWYKDNADGKTHRVGLKKANRWGIYDMYGNTWEWCSSKYQSFPCRADDGREDLADDGALRAVRSYSWNFGSAKQFSANRGAWPPSACYDASGLRLCVPVEAAAPER